MTSEAIIPSSSKHCSRCNQSRSLHDFSKNRKSEDGHCNCCKQCQRNYYTLNKEKVKIRSTNWRKSHPEKIQQYRITYRKKQENKVKHKLRKHLKEALFGKYQSSHYLTHFGCSVRDLQNHFTTQFKSGMSWENYGDGPTEWCVDHIIPNSAFNYSEPSHVYWCWSYKNMRPIWNYENASKSDQIADSNIRQYKYANQTQELNEVIGSELERLGITTKIWYLNSLNLHTKESIPLEVASQASRSSPS